LSFFCILKKKLTQKGWTGQKVDSLHPTFSPILARPQDPLTKTHLCLNF